MAKILVIEPDEVLRNSVANRLRELGHESIVVEPIEFEKYVETVADVINRVTGKEEQYDAVIMAFYLTDVPQPGVRPINGDSFAGQLGYRREKGLKVISMSGMSSSSVEWSLYDSHICTGESKLASIEEQLGNELGKLFPKESGLLLV